MKATPRDPDSDARLAQAAALLREADGLPIGAGAGTGAGIALGALDARLIPRTLLS